MKYLIEILLVLTILLTCINIVTQDTPIIIENIICEETQCLTIDMETGETVSYECYQPVHYGNRN